MNKTFSSRIKNDSTYIHNCIQQIEENTDYYLSRWQNSKQPLQFSGWNWAAFCLGPFWLSYRHMYGWVLIYFLILLTGGIVQSISPLFTNYTPFDLESLFLWNYIWPVLISLFFGWKGNAIFARHIQQQLDDKHKRKTAVPLFHKPGRSLISAIITPIVFFLVFLLPFQWIYSWEFESAIPYGVYVFDGDKGVYSTINQEDDFVFEKYTSSEISLLYHGTEDVGDSSLYVVLYFRDSDELEWEKIWERSYHIFSSNMVTLTILDAGDPLTEVGEYSVEVHIDDELKGKRVFHLKLAQEQNR
ncbi:DUF2628 domain-containing protein [Evansella tamaricis]|uniref:DUF2628 domain-containing protein n=1 Tax=Evansella tamaricis TaxID=2069301 RepID=A0ABS6JQL9_9BACI|nr:DUF2628 domain-containing protein [Evansella tamaricis]MBU9714608.1 DUF2628 domain-containing protein [Evansella tamaricis]